ncbi:MAG: hypothetical protein O2960_30830 [Verrucomicrobia bacterium]|nr:hypothetical protein [Verrucomicrobiota bacterium]
MSCPSFSRLERDLGELSHAFQLWIDEDNEFVVVSGVRLPPGYNTRQIDVLIELPDDYPFSPPGVADSPVYLPPNLRFRGRALDDLHKFRTPCCETPGFGPWAWFCYEDVQWSPENDNLIKFLEMIRADLTNPETS